MSLATLLSRPCTIIRRSSSANEDRYGNLIPTEDLISTTCEIQQAERSEEAGGAIAESLWRGYFPVNVDLQAEDAIEVGGFEYELVGDPWKADTGSTAVHHLEADLRRTGGVEDVS